MKNKKDFLEIFADIFATLMVLAPITCIVLTIIASIPPCDTPKAEIRCQMAKRCQIRGAKGICIAWEEAEVCKEVKYCE